MLDALIQTIEVWPLSVALRKSLWIYPLVNAAHILGLAMLVGAIGTLDLRLLGLWRSQPVRVLANILVDVARVGLMLAIATGSLLFIARPADYFGHSLFQLKMVLIAIGLLNIWLNHRHLDWQNLADDGPVTTRLKVAASISLLGWLTVLLLGRLLGYR